MLSMKKDRRIIRKDVWIYKLPPSYR